ncbi:MAG: HAD hydrolase family protein, partial [Sulfurimonas sp.]|nr:HAD hydrolase family protein [Sulfurimonas sp.]
QTRADELGIQHLFQGVKDKDRVLKELVENLGLKFYEVAAIGDDFNDYNMLNLVGRSFSPNDGVDDIKDIVDTVLTKNGGDGAVREMIDILVDESDLKDKFLSVWV